MTYQQNRWNEKYANRGPKLPVPERFVIERTHLLCPGTVLDVACGDGRHSIYLARSGFAVTGVDFSEKGLARLCSTTTNEVILTGMCFESTSISLAHNRYSWLEEKRINKRRVKRVV